MRRPAAEGPCPDVLSGHCCFLGQNTKDHSIPSTVAKAARNLSLLVVGFSAYLCGVERVLIKNMVDMWWDFVVDFFVFVLYNVKRYRLALLAAG